MTTLRLRKPREPKCPACGAGVGRPKCAFELGAYCPRHPLREKWMAECHRIDKLRADHAAEAEAEWIVAELARLRALLKEAGEAGCWYRAMYESLYERVDTERDRTDDALKAKHDAVLAKLAKGGAVNEIKRFQFVECYPANGDPTYSDIKPDPEGAYVLYSDHLAALAERDEKIAAFSVDAGAVLSSALAERDAEIARLRALLKEAEEAMRSMADGDDISARDVDAFHAVLAKLAKEGLGG